MHLLCTCYGEGRECPLGAGRRSCPPTFGGAKRVTCRECIHEWPGRSCFSHSCPRPAPH